MPKNKNTSEKDAIQQKVVFVFDNIKHEETFEDFVVKYVALLHRWNKRQGGTIQLNKSDRS